MTSIALKNMDQCESPEELVVGAFARCIRDAYAKYDDIVKYGVTVDSKHLDYPIEVPYRYECHSRTFLNRSGRGTP